jgi:hypothetical protein
LGAGGVNATVRANRGTDIAAACGQLAAREQQVTLRRVSATLKRPTGATLSSSG